MNDELIERVEKGERARGEQRFEQRHFRSWLGTWSDWYPSSEAAYREDRAGPVKNYQVRAHKEQHDG